MNPNAAGALNVTSFAAPPRVKLIGVIAVNSQTDWFNRAGSSPTL